MVCSPDWRLYASISLYYTAVPAALLPPVSQTIQASHILLIMMLLCMSCQTSGYQYNDSKRKLPRTRNRTVRIYAAVISIFLPLTLFHSKQTAPSTLKTDVATAT